jgi:ribonuclease E
MSKQMLIDAQHEGETRVVVLDENDIDDFDFITAAKLQLKGNIFLAKVTRVEPSLQAAFVEYGGNKQGFLPFSEIHPDYYQIPVEDKQRLLAEEAEVAKAEEEAEEKELDDEESKPKRSSRRRRGGRRRRGKGDDAPAGEEGEEGYAALDQASDEIASDETFDDADDEEDAKEEEVETLIADDREEVQKQKGSLFKRYRIQEVIKRGQIMLVQVIKEERGNKGCSMTSYISLAGRYCVLMPNSIKAGGVSRKISNGEQRRKLKSMLQEFKDKRGLNAIIRTAGLDRTKAEIKRDYEYLVKLWSQVRETTLASTAPALIYEESDIIKRSIRDMYTSDIEGVLVQGEQAYKDAKNFMKLIMPSHAPRVKLYKEARPLFAEYEVEDSLASIYEPEVRLPSGGSLVIQSTEALISIDVNSGRSTSERNVEETAIKTNLEAAREVARQLRLRDLAGIVVVDFIDMYYGKNRRSLERAMRDALKRDRAKIQVSRISPFGLIELSRQRLRPSITESSMVTCQHCKGTGIVPSTETAMIQIIRIVEREAASGDYTHIHVESTPTVIMQLVNEKRELIQQFESDYNISISFSIGEETGTNAYAISKTTPDGRSVRHDEKDEPRRKRRGKRGGRNRRKEGDFVESREAKAEEVSEEPRQAEQEEGEAKDAKEGKKPSRSRPRRGNRRRNTSEDKPAAEEQVTQDAEVAATADDDAPAVTEDATEEKSGSRRRAAPRRKRKPEASEAVAEEAPAKVEAVAEPELKVVTAEQKAPAASAEIVDHSDAKDDKPKKRGWWNRVVEG